MRAAQYTLRQCHPMNTVIIIIIIIIIVIIIYHYKPHHKLIIIRPHRTHSVHKNDKMQPIAADGVAWHVCLSVCLFVAFVISVRTI